MLPLVLIMGLFKILPPVLRPEMFGAIAIAHFTMMRAVIVPSSPARTVFVAIVLVVPVAVGAYVYYVNAARADLPPPWVYTLVVSAWGTASTVMSTWPRTRSSVCASGCAKPPSSGNTRSSRRSARAAWASSTAPATRCCGDRPR